MHLFQRQIVHMDVFGRDPRVLAAQPSMDPEVSSNNDDFWYTQINTSGLHVLRGRLSVPNAQATVLKTADGKVFAQPALAPDGQKLAVTVLDLGTRVSWVATCTPKGEDLKLLAQGSTPRWSPDGQWLVFDRRLVAQSSDDDDKNIYQIQRIAVKGGEAETLVRGPGSNNAPEFSPDGKSLVFRSNRDGHFHLYQLDLASQVVQAVTQGPSDEHHPAFGRDGWLYFVSNAGGSVDIWRAKVQ